MLIMGRGPGLKTLKYKAQAEAEGRALGELKAQKHMETLGRNSDNKDPMSYLNSLREHISKVIDRIDPLELTAVIGTTLIIKNGIDWTATVLAPMIVESLILPAQKLTATAGEIIAEAYKSVTTLQPFNLAPLIDLNPSFFIPILTAVFGTPPQKEKGQTQFGASTEGSTVKSAKLKVGQESLNINVEICQWLISFAIAYMIVKNFGAIITGATNILSFAKNLLIPTVIV